MDAKQPPDAGLIQGKHLWLHRAKGGCNPWAVIHDDLAAVIEAHRAWHAANHPNNPDWFPHRDSKTRPAETSAMTQQLRRAAKELGTPARTSHGLRAYYVTVRRSQGIPDGQIAAEIS